MSSGKLCCLFLLLKLSPLRGLGKTDSFPKTIIAETSVKCKAYLIFRKLVYAGKGFSFHPLINLSLPFFQLQQLDSQPLCDASLNMKQLLQIEEEAAAVDL